MRFMKQPMLWRILLIVSAAFIAIPIAAHVGSNATAVVNDRQASASTESRAENEHARVSDTARTNVVVAHVAKLPQDYYDRRRQYWENRVDRRIERRQQYIDDQVDREESRGSSKNSSKNNRSNSAASNDDEEDDEDEDDAGGPADDEGDRVERRREYWRQRVDRNW